MATSVKSARGALVDFDLLKIKQQMSRTPVSSTVKAREDFIDQKSKRRLKRLTRKATDGIVDAGSAADSEPNSNEEESE